MHVVGVVLTSNGIVVIIWKPRLLGIKGHMFEGGDPPYLFPSLVGLVGNSLPDEIKVY